MLRERGISAAQYQAVAKSLQGDRTRQPDWTCWTRNGLGALAGRRAEYLGIGPAIAGQLSGVSSIILHMPRQS